MEGDCSFGVRILAYGFSKTLLARRLDEGAWIGSIEWRTTRWLRRGCCAETSGRMGDSRGHGIADDVLLVRLIRWYRSAGMVLNEEKETKDWVNNKSMHGRRTSLNLPLACLVFVTLKPPILQVDRLLC